MQRFARGTGPRDGSANAKEHFAIKTRRVGLFTQYNLLWDCRNIVRCLWIFATQVSGITGSCVFNDRVGVALGSLV